MPTAAPLPSGAPEDLEAAGELDQGYGLGRLWLAARDPHTLHVTWDLTPEQTKIAAGRMAVRIRAATAPAAALQQVEVGDRTRSAFVHVEHPGGLYEAEVGFHDAGGTWHSFAAAIPVSTPPQRSAEGGKPRFVKVVVEASEPPPGFEPEPERGSRLPAVAAPMPPHSPTAFGGQEESPISRVEPVSSPFPAPSEPFVPSAPPAGPTPPPPLTPPPPPPFERAFSPPAVPATGHTQTEPAACGVTMAGAAPAPWPQVPIEAAHLVVPPGSEPTRTPVAPSAQESFTVGTGEWSPASAMPPVAWRVRWVEMPAPVLSLAEEQIFRELAGLTAAMADLPSSPGVPPSAAPGAFALRGFGVTRPLGAGVGAGLPSSEAVIPPSGAAAAAGALRGFWFNVNAELIVYGATEPDAQVTIDGEPIVLRPDGSFTLRFALPDGDYGLSAVAVSAAGDDSRGARLEFLRRTAYRGGVGKHPTDPALVPPPAGKGRDQG